MCLALLEELGIQQCHSKGHRGCANTEEGCPDSPGGHRPRTGPGVLQRQHVAPGRGDGMGWGTGGFKCVFWVNLLLSFICVHT